MSLAGFNVDWSTVEDIGFKPLPEGVYGAKITKSSVKSTKKGDGKYIHLELTLVGSDGVKGRKIFDMFNMQHPNEQAVKIGQSKLKKLIELLDKDPNSVQDTSELHGLLIGVNLKVKNDDEYGTQNRISHYVRFTEDLLNQNQDDSSPF